MTNRLANESSPYLLQHAENPVDWYPWCTEALLRSRAEDKPIFLSIGYSACHWCHVMEHESFEDHQIAEMLNENFVSIKVDREERPDIDQIYMQAVMALQGHGGWPLSAFLTPDQNFFFGGTYWPPRSRGNMPGFDHVLNSVLDAYHNRRESVESQSKQITQMLQGQDAAESAEQNLEPSLIYTAAKQLRNRWDGDYGGFGGAPKFPHPMDLNLLQRLIGRSFDDSVEIPPNDEILQMVEVTLTKMAYGGIYDHLGGGFARYSVDARWLVPHFEKMLYDNAQLATVYLTAHRITGRPVHRRVCEKTLEYLLEYMLDECGAFHSTEDADSEGEEGKFYVWTPDEVIHVLGEDVGQQFCDLYDVTRNGNWEGRSILNLPKSYAEFADETGIDKNQLRIDMREARTKLLAVRDGRVRPGKDDKVIVSWNALAIDAFAQASVVLDNEEYGKSAVRSANFIWEHMRQTDGRLFHTWRGGRAKLNAYLDDYSSLVVAFLSLYRMEFDSIWLERANGLADTMIKHFADHQCGGFYFTADDHEELIARTKDYQDGSVPGGNSMAAIALTRLGRLFANQDYLDLAKRTISSSIPLLSRAPLAGSQMLIALDQYLFDDHQYVLVCGSDHEENRQAIRFVQMQLDFGACFVVINGAPNELLSKIGGEKHSIDDQPTLYICKQYHCEKPVVGITNIQESIESPLGSHLKIESN